MANIEKKVSSSGEVTYRVKVRLKGFPVQTATFDRLKQMQSVGANKLKQRYTKEDTLKPLWLKTFANLIDRNMRDILPLKPKSIKA